MNPSSGHSWLRKISEETSASSHTPGPDSPEANPGRTSASGFNEAHGLQAIEASWMIMPPIEHNIDNDPYESIGGYTPSRGG